MGTAEEPAFDLYAVTEDAAVAVLAAGRKALDRTLEAVKGVHTTTHRAHLEGHPVVVAAHVTGRHDGEPEAGTDDPQLFEGRTEEG